MRLRRGPVRLRAGPVRLRADRGGPVRRVCEWVVCNAVCVGGGGDDPLPVRLVPNTTAPPPLLVINDWSLIQGGGDVSWCVKQGVL